MRWRHPSTSKLRSWLDGEMTDPKVDGHIDTCERCASRLEDLASPEAPLAVALSIIFAPPDGLVPRLNTGIDARLRNRADLALLAGMLGLPVQTAKLLFDEDQD